MKRTNWISTATLVLFAASLILIAAGAAMAGERQVDTTIKATYVQAEILPAVKKKCPDGTQFTTEYKGKELCRKCPEGSTYYAELKSCMQCPAGRKFEMYYPHTDQKWDPYGMCTVYRDK